MQHHVIQQEGAVAAGKRECVLQDRGARRNRQFGGEFLPFGACRNRLDGVSGTAVGAARQIVQNREIQLRLPGKFVLEFHFEPAGRGIQKFVITVNRTGFRPGMGKFERTPARGEIRGVALQARCGFGGIGRQIGLGLEIVFQHGRFGFGFCAGEGQRHRQQQREDIT